MSNASLNKKIISIFVILILIIAGTVLYLQIEKEPTKELKKDEEKEYDFRISPYTNQGLFVEVLRIRHRGLLEKILNFGRSWRNVPSFYYTVDVDGKVGNSKGNVGESGVFNVWDTLGKESHISYYIPEEQKQSKVTISIVEQVKKGMIGFRTEDVEKEKIELTYDYRTGRWSGNDNFNDEDGYGHFLGDTFEVWFNIYQSDFDHDGIPFFIEKNVIDTDPTVDDSKLDPDGDKIPTSWEWKWGYDPHTWDDHVNLDPDVDGIENIEEYHMRKYLANPFQPDMYIETDGMEKKRLIELPHYFPKESQQMLIELFAQHGINAYVDDGWPDGPKNGGGEMLPFHENFNDVSGKQTLSFYEHNFADERKGIFRYVIIGHKYDGFTNPCKYVKFDLIHVGTNLKTNFLIRSAFTPRTFKVTIAKTILHEIGHTLGLVPVTFYGNDIMPGENLRWPDSLTQEEYDKYIENYHSVMNYYYLFRDKKLFDFSDGSNNAKYDYDDWGNIYLPTFQIDQTTYEEPTDSTFEDLEIVDDYPGVVLNGWEYDKSLTEKHLEQSKNLNFGLNEYEYQIYVEKENKENIKVFARPLTKAVVTQYSLIANGKIDSNNQLVIYSTDEEINNLLSMFPN
jgi:hypothetical protein